MEPETEFDMTDIRLQENQEELNSQEAKPFVAADEKLPIPNRGCLKLSQKKQTVLIHINRRRLGSLLDRLAAAHCWREASAVLSLLFKGNQRTYSPSVDRKNFLIAMEIQKRFYKNKNYPNLIKNTFETWLSKLSWYERGEKKKRLFKLELALFHLSQGKFSDAQDCTRHPGNLPFINLIHGLIRYQLWYADLPKEMQITCFNAHTMADDFRMTVIDGYQETGIGESSNGHDAVDIKSTKASSESSSESSFANDKIFMEEKNSVPQKVFGDTFSVQDHIGQSSEDDEEGGLPRNYDNFINTTNYYASGMDKILLPIQSKLLTEDHNQSKLMNRKLANENYKDAEKHLRLALHSSPPLLAALLPLIQLLLLGGRVHEAIVELDKSCHAFDSALPFRLKARLLQCFSSSQISMISSCYENALTRDPACTYSMEKLIKMQKTGNYSILQLLEMFATHLDAVDGKCSIWEEFASCFLKLQTVILYGHEDCISTNVKGAIDDICCNKIPIMFTKGETGYTWKLRCRWWASHHFGRSICHSEIQAGEWMLLQHKAACAAHLYGPDCEYLTAILSRYTEQGNSDGLSYLQHHIRNTMNLAENLVQL